MTLRWAKETDWQTLCQLDRHIAPEELRERIARQGVLVAEKTEMIGWLRYNLFWDNTPFINLLYVREDQRGKGIGRLLVLRWEEEMRQRGYISLMTSTASDEYAQHFYAKLGYRAVGGFCFRDDPYELLFEKELS